MDTKYCIFIFRRWLSWWFSSKESTCSSGAAGVEGLIPGEGNATHSSILAWRIQWTEEPGGLWSMGSQRVRYDWAANSWANVNSEYKPVSEARVFLCSVFVFPQKKCRKHLGKLVCASRIKAYENSVIAFSFRLFTWNSFQDSKVSSDTAWGQSPP